jgi:hypothetical protein
VYFLTFHTPFHIQFAAAAPAVSQPALPHFDVQAGIDHSKLSVGDTQTIRITVTPKQTVSAYLEIWIRGPKIREIYKYPASTDTNPPTHFVAGQPQVFTETYTVQATIPAGIYMVSASIVSVNLQIDYYNAHNFASFEVL